MAINEREVRARIQAAVTASGLTQAEWARAHGVSPSALSESINGPGVPRPSVLQALGIRRQREQGRGYTYQGQGDEA